MPAATTVLWGTEATAGLLLLNATTAPPEGRGPLRVTVPVTLPPPTTLEALSPRLLIVGVPGGPAPGVTVSCTDRVRPSSDAVSVTFVATVTVLVLMANDCALDPAGTFTLAG